MEDGPASSTPTEPVYLGTPRNLGRSSIQDVLRKFRGGVGCTDGTSPILRREGLLCHTDEIVRTPERSDFVVGRTVTHGGPRRTEQQRRFADGSPSYVPGGQRENNLGRADGKEE